MREQWSPARGVRLDAGDTGAEAVSTVVSVRAADQVRALGLPAQGTVRTRDLRRGVDGVAAAAGEKDSSVIDRREPGEPVGEL